AVFAGRTPGKRHDARGPARPVSHHTRSVTPRRWAVRAVGTAVLLALAACSGAGPAAPPSADPPADGPPAAGGPTEWPGYHADQARTGAIDAASPRDVSRAWTAALGGAVRGQPVAAGGRLVAATETDRVVALDPG